MTLSLLRWSFVVAILLPYIYTKKSILFKALRENFLILLLLGALGIAGFNAVLYFGLQYTSATNSLLINSSIPILIIVLNLLITKTKIQNKQLVGIILSTIGVIYLVIKGDFTNIMKLSFNKGDFLIIISSLIWALYSIFLKYKPKELKPFEFMSLIALLGFIILLITYYATGHQLDAKILGYDNSVYLIVLYMAIFPSLLSFYFWNKGILELGANTTGQFTHLMPVFGIFLAFIFLGETLESFHIYGILLIAIGIYLSMFAKSKKA
ncbi:MAG: DMT family transporter [Sulfurimonas sp.]|nr:DMT family transporter [Sulfurimonas sp.]